MPTVKFSDWLDSGLPDLPSEQTIPGDQMIVIRSGLPYAFDPRTRFAYASFIGNASMTTINTQNVWESIGGTLAASGGEEGLSFAANVFTVTAETSLVPVQIQAGVSFERDGNGDDNFQFGIFVNGSISGVPIAASGNMNKANSVYVTVPSILVNGDTIEIKVRNLDDDVDVLVTDMFFGIS
jgi:hypothetical protein